MQSIETRTHEFIAFSFFFFFLDIMICAKPKLLTLEVEKFVKLPSAEFRYGFNSFFYKGLRYYSWTWLSRKGACHSQYYMDYLFYSY